MEAWLLKTARFWNMFWFLGTLCSKESHTIHFSQCPHSFSNNQSGTGNTTKSTSANETQNPTQSIPGKKAGNETKPYTVHCLSSRSPDQLIRTRNRDCLTLQCCREILLITHAIPQVPPSVQIYFSQAFWVSQKQDFWGQFTSWPPHDNITEGKPDSLTKV